MQSFQFQRRDYSQSHRATADHQRHFVAAYIGLGDRVDADRQWFGQCRMLRRKSVGHLQQQRLAEQHALGVAADIVVGIADALRSIRHQQGGKRADPCTGFQLALGPRPVIDDLAAEFMTEHHVAGEVHRFAAWKMPRQFDHAMGMFARMQVRSAKCRRPGS